MDNLAEGLTNRGLKVLRYGAKIRIRESLWPITLDGYIERHPSQRNLNSLKLKTFAASPGSGMRSLPILHMPIIIAEVVRFACV